MSAWLGDFASLFYSLAVWLAGISGFLGALVVLIGGALILLSLVEDDDGDPLNPRDYDW